MTDKLEQFIEPDVWVTLQGKRVACLEVLEKMKSVLQIDKVSDIYIDSQSEDDVRIYLNISTKNASPESSDAGFLV